MRRQPFAFGQQRGRAAQSPAFAGSRAIRLMRLTKSATLNGLAKRAVPSVGITWLGPAT